jgi:hypothetical protein
MRPSFRNEDGSIMLGMAMALVAFAFLGLTVLEAGQWFAHRRHLQVRADAAVLAGAQNFNACFDTAAFTPDTADTFIEQGITGQTAGAANYAGSSTAAFNQGWQKGLASSSESLGFQFTDGNFPSGGGTSHGTLGRECDTLKLDVSLTQAGLPRLLFLSGLTTVHARARVELKQAEALQPSFPLAIPNFDLSHIGVTFVDETTGGELQGCGGSALVAGTSCTYAIPGPATPATAADGEAVALWTLPSTSTQVKLPSPTANGDLIGVRVSAGPQIGSCAAASGTPWACFELGNTNGLIGIRDYPTPATPAIPQLYEVYPSSCSPDTSPFFSSAGVPSGSCVVTLQARVDFGTGATNPETGSLGAALQATMPNGTTMTLHVVAGSANARGWLWQGTTPISVGAQSAQSEYPVTLNWTSQTKINNKKSGTLAGGNVVQRFTAANTTDDGPVDMVSLNDSTAGVTSPYSYAFVPGGSNLHSIGVTVAVAGTGIPLNQLQVLRASHGGSATSWLLCVAKGNPPSPYSPEGGNPGIQDGMQNGCSFSYAINPTATCPDANGAQPIPADCVPNKPSSDEGNAVKTALNARFGCTTGSPALNNWPNYSIAGDPRAVTMITTTYNAFSSGGSQPYPVTGFGAFYITGFSGDQCPTRTANQQPAPGLDDPAPGGPNAGNIVGYFIQYLPAQGTPDITKDCVKNQFQACVAVLTR